ncbi:helix-turn-helix domain-containing protein [uncultured Sutterella sp.]|uniref:helix-turn-helix domain-containing protein n=1 Tax=uncultured Sutterella sp. TaxID=286133 RepID=UPI0026DC6ADF|nr:helix-turn-helix domain-containing protein [uncultured Sutterella sp.]
MAKQTTGDDKMKSALFWLAFHLNDETGECFPSISTLQAEMEVKSDNTVRGALRRLREAGFISWERETKDGLTVKTNYHLHMNGSMAEGTSTSAVPQPLREGTSTVERGTSTIAGGVLQPVRTNREIEQGINKERNKEVMCAPSGAPYPEDFDQSLFDEAQREAQLAGEKPNTVKAEAPKRRTATPRKKPATRCPFDAEALIPDDYRQIAEKAGIGDPQRVFSTFVNHALAHDRRLVIWPAGFRTWCSNELKWHPDQKPKPKPLHQRTADDYNW